MQKTLKIFTCMAFFTLFACSPLGASEVVNKPFHQDIKCEKCHQGQFNNRVPTDACTGCHLSGIELAKKKEGVFLNPHNSPHWGTTVECSVCHKEHQPSQLICVNCHPKMQNNLK